VCVEAFTGESLIGLSSRGEAPRSSRGAEANSVWAVGRRGCELAQALGGNPWADFAARSITEAGRRVKVFFERGLRPRRISRTDGTVCTNPTLG
jgi:hypothetical protein